MACKGCKSKNIDELVEDNSNKLPKSYKLLIFIYTLLCIYGLISLIFDIVSIFS
jgi:hypothetical protein